jgi:uroporphyrinogen decarboxylase
MSQMTSRERVLAALSHKEPDRVPIDLGGMGMFTCWHEKTDAKVKEYLGLDGHKQILNSFISRTVRPDERIRERFQTDFFGLVTSPPSAWELEVHTDEEGGTWFVDEWQCKWRCPPDGFYYDIVEHPLRDATVADVARFRWPDPCDPGRLQGVPELAKDVYENTDYALCFTPVWATGVFLMGSLLMGWENHFVSLLKNKPVVQAIYDAMGEFQAAHWGAILDAVGDYIHAGVMSDDLGFQDQPIIRLQVFRDMLKRPYTKIIDAVKSKKPDFKLVFHSDGAIRQFLPDFVDMGVDALNPIQVSCPGMADTAALKRDFGADLVFWGGGVDTQYTLPFGSPDEVRAEVQRRIQDLAPGGGYIFATVHNVQPGVPVENILACYDTAIEHRAYPIPGA